MSYQGRIGPSVSTAIPCIAIVTTSHCDIRFTEAAVQSIFGTLTRSFALFSFVARETHLIETIENRQIEKIYLIDCFEDWAETSRLFTMFKASGRPLQITYIRT
jgi:hypothetical protein